MMEEGEEERMGRGGGERNGRRGGKRGGERGGENGRTVINSGASRRRYNASTSDE